MSGFYGIGLKLGLIIYLVDELESNEGEFVENTIFSIEANKEELELLEIGFKEYLVHEDDAEAY